MGKKKKLFNSLSEEDMHKKLASAADEKSEAYVWESSDSNRELFYITEYLKEEQYFILRAGSKETKLCDKECLINFEAEERDFFSAGTLLPRKEGLYNFSLGNKLFRFDKRKNLRIPAEFTDDITFKVNRQKDFHFSGINISENGVGLVCNEDKSSVFTVNKKFRDVYLEFNGKNYAIELVIVQYNGPHDSEEGKIQVGLFFKTITETVKFNIKKEVQKCLLKALKKKKAES